MSCRVVRGGRLSDRFHVRIGVVIIVHVSSRYRLDYEDHHRGKGEWNSADTSDTARVLNFADNFALLSYNRHQM